MSSYNVMPFDPERVRVQKFTQARAMAKDCASRPKGDGRPGTICVSMANGKKRWVTFTDEGEFISVKLIDTIVLRFYSRWIDFRTGGYNSVTTRSVINNLLPAGAVTATEKAGQNWQNLFYEPMNGTDGPVPVPNQELSVRYTGQIVSDEAKTPKVKKEKKEQPQPAVAA
jgi:hypothetical protein